MTHQFAGRNFHNRSADTPNHPPELSNSIQAVQCSSIMPEIIWMRFVEVPVREMFRMGEVTPLISNGGGWR
ncbi:MAG: hypothetical protein ACXWFG_16030 [Methylobacter sp.]